MKTIKLMLIALVSVCAIFATSCKEEEKIKEEEKYSYTLAFEMVDAGDLSAADKTTLETLFKQLKDKTGVLVKTPGEAQSKLNAAAPEFVPSFQAAIGAHAKEVKIKVILYNVDTKTNEFSTNVIVPAKK